MSDRAPPFSALRAVEAASRHKSFTWAAKELNITHSAVSQSIRRLEADLGATLFERKGGAMQPSEAALRLAQSYSEAALSLRQTIRGITGDTDSDCLSFGLPDASGRQWFAAKAGRLAETMPDMRLILGEADARQQEVEVLFVDQPLASDHILLEISLFPVCRPDMLAKTNLRDAASVMKLPLLAYPQFGWPLWTKRHSAKTAAPIGKSFDDSQIAIEAAARGEGVALAHLISAEPLISEGRLAALPFSASTETKLVLRSRAPAIKLDLVERLLMWMKLEIARSAALLKAA